MQLAAAANTDDGSCAFDDALVAATAQPMQTATGGDDEDYRGAYDECGVQRRQRRPGRADVNATTRSHVGRRFLLVLDALGVCGGDCAADADGDGVCDDVDDCVGAYDACGVCNGPGDSFEAVVRTSLQATAIATAPT